MPLFLLVSCAEPEPGLTIDIIDGTYVGEVTEEDLLPAVVVVDADSTLTIAFYSENAVLWAKATFHGKIAKGLDVLEGPQTTRIEGVTVDGDWLECTYVVSGFPLGVTGVFALEHEALTLTIEELGNIDLARVVTEGDTADTGA